MVGGGNGVDVVVDVFMGSVFAHVPVRGGIDPVFSLLVCLGGDSVELNILLDIFFNSGRPL